MLFEEPKHVRKLRTGHASNAHNLADLAVITTTRIHDLSDRVSTCPVRVFPILGLSSFAPQTAEKISAPGRSTPGRFGTGGGSRVGAPKHISERGRGVGSMGSSRDISGRGGASDAGGGQWANRQWAKKRPGKGPGRKREPESAGAGQAPGKPETVRTTRRTRRCRP